MPFVQATDVPAAPPGGLPQAGSLPNAYQNIQSTPASFGALEGQALEQLGSTLDRGASAFADRAIEMQKIHNQTVVENANSQYMKESNDDLFGTPDRPGYYATKGMEAQYKYTDVRKNMEDREKNIMAGLQNDAQRLAFQHETRYQRRWMDRDIASHYQKELTKANDAALEGAFATATNVAGKNFHDDDRTRDAFLAADALAVSKGLGDPAATEAFRQKFRDQVYVERVRGYAAQEDWTGARAFLDKSMPYISDAQVRQTLNTMVNDKAIAADINSFYTSGGQFLGPPPKTSSGGGTFSAPAGPPIAGASLQEQRLMNEVRFRESSHNYTAIGPTILTGRYQGQTAKGAYGFLDDTWKEAARATGLGTEFATADKAPPATQDANALWLYRNRGTAPWSASGPYPSAAGGRTAAYGTAAGIEPAFSGSIDTMIADAAKAGVTLARGSGKRTTEEQTKLYNDWVAGGRKGAPVARPGASQHEVGRATDLVDARGELVSVGSPEDRWLTANQGNYRIHRPVRGEPWHIQPTGAQAAHGRAPSPAMELAPVPNFTGAVLGAQGPAYAPTAPGMRTTEGSGGGGPMTADEAGGGADDSQFGVGGALAPRPVPEVPLLATRAPLAAPAYVPPAGAPATPPPIPDAPTPARDARAEMAAIAARYPNPTDQVKAFEAYQHRFNAENAILQQEHRARVALSDAALGEYVTRIARGEYAGVLEDIQKGEDRRLLGTTSHTIYEMALAERRRAEDKWPKTLGPGFYDVLQRITNDARSEDRITDSTQIYALAGPTNWLTIQGANQLTEILTSKSKTTHGHADAMYFDQLFKTAHARLTFTGLEAAGFKDDQGEMLHSQFIHQALPVIDKLKKEGVPMAEITDLDKGPLKPILDHLVRSPAVIMQNIMTRSNQMQQILDQQQGRQIPGAAAPGAVLRYDRNGNPIGTPGAPAVPFAPR